MGHAQNLNTPTGPHSETAELARVSARELRKLLDSRPESDRASVKLSDQDLIFPREALELLQDILVQMAKGDSVTIMPIHAELTTQEAANLLNISRPFLIGLLEKQEIPHKKVGTHRRLRLQDVMEYRRKQEKISKDALQELADIAQENDMGY